MSTPITVMVTSATVNATPIRILTARSVPRIPTPTDTANTSSPSESATNRILKKAATVIARAARSGAQNRQRIGEEQLHRRAQLRERERFVEERLRARVHRVVVVAADHHDRHARRRAVLAHLRDQLDPGDPRQHEVADEDVERVVALDVDERALGVVAERDVVRSPGEDRLDQRAYLRVVVRDQDAPSHRSRVPPFRPLAYGPNEKSAKRRSNPSSGGTPRAAPNHAEARRFVAVLDVIQTPKFQQRFFFLAKRFIAGETVAQAMDAVAAINAQGMSATLDFLGEDVTARPEAERTRDAYFELLEAIRARGVDTNVSVKLTAMGLLIDEDFALANLRSV